MKFCFSEQTLSGYEKDLKQIFKKFPQDKEHIQNVILGLLDSTQGSMQYPGFPSEIRKLKIGLPKNNISSQKGLRLIFLVGKTTITVLALYYKAELNDETQVKGLIKDRLSWIADNQ